jgi:hypothetical protein
MGMVGNAAAQCCGDCAGDGSVTIDDLIKAVNNALNGCSQPPTATEGTPATPTRTPPPTKKPTNTRKPTATVTPQPRCASTFQTQGNNLCLFNGTFNRGCGNAISSTYSSNGTIILVTLATGVVSPPTVSFRAAVTSATNANLTAWSTDNFQTINLVSGAVNLNSDGAQLEIFPNSPPFSILSCQFVQYLGAFQPPRSADVAALADDIPELAP